MDWVWSVLRNNKHSVKFTDVRLDIKIYVRTVVRFLDHVPSNIARRKGRHERKSKSKSRNLSP